jgi:hypothetical protein
MKNIKLSGMTLIETILYLGMAVIVLGVLFSYGWNIIGINMKTQVVQETTRSAQLVEEKLQYEIRSADSVAVSENPVKLELQTDGDTVTIEDAGNKITIKRGSADPVVLNSQWVQIKNFVLTKQVFDADEIQFVGISFEAVANYPGSSERSEYQYSLPVNFGVALRR